MLIGGRIEKLREQRGWSQGELARRAETSQETIATIERGRQKSSKTPPRIARALGVEVAELDPDYAAAPTLGADGSGRALLSEEEAIDALTWALAALRVASEPEARVLARAVIRALREPAPTEAERRAAVERAVRLFRP